MKMPVGRGTTPVRGLTNHRYLPLTNWDDPPSTLTWNSNDSCFLIGKNFVLKGSTLKIEDKRVPGI